MSRLHLASRSPRRRELLAQAGVPFEVLDIEVDESTEPGLSPEEVVRVLARRKAVAGAQSAEEGWVLGADTIVATLEGLLGKPRDREHARQMLSAISGTTHRVLTGVCLLECATGRSLEAVDVTRITMRKMTREEISSYVESGEADDKAGAYAIQETADRFVTRIDGSWTNVVGLPMEALRGLLLTAGIVT